MDSFGIVHYCQQNNIQDQNISLHYAVTYEEVENINLILKEVIEQANIEAKEGKKEFEKLIIALCSRLSSPILIAPADPLLTHNIHIDIPQIQSKLKS